MTRAARLGPVVSRSRADCGESCAGVSREGLPVGEKLAIGTECVTGGMDNGPKASCTPAGK
ncbi:hypothetical protein GCM10010349_50390 [Streptomyces flavofungini]|nr:hypothetical protein GCM10010349_50390 [Streptomyces flavofungini]